MEGEMGVPLYEEMCGGMKGTMGGWLNGEVSGCMDGGKEKWV